MRDGWSPKVRTGQQAIDELEEVWREYRAGEPPIENVEIRDTRTGSGPSNWEDGTITVAGELVGRDYGAFENTVMRQMEEAFEEAIEGEVENQKEILRQRFDFLDNFKINYNGTQVADLDAEALHGGKKRRFLDNSSGEDYVVVDYSYMPWIDPLANEVEGPAERVIRHETVHAAQAAINPEFKDLWRRTGVTDIERASTEGLARYEQYKGTDKDRKAEEAIENPGNIPEFWRKFVLDDNMESSNPYAYGEMAAYFLEEAFRNQASESYVLEGQTDLDGQDERIIDRLAENRVRKTMLNNIWKQDLDTVLRKASDKMDFLFFGELLEEEYQRLKAYSNGVDNYEVKIASPEGKTSAVQILQGEDAANRYIDSLRFKLKQAEDYGINEYLQGHARLIGAERLGLESEPYEKLKTALQSAR